MRKNRKAVKALKSALREFQDKGLAKLAVDLKKRGKVFRNQNSSSLHFRYSVDGSRGNPLSYRGGHSWSTEGRLSGKSDHGNAFAVAWDARNISKAEVLRHVKNEMRRRKDVARRAALKTLNAVVPVRAETTLVSEPTVSVVVTEPLATSKEPAVPAEKADQPSVECAPDGDSEHH